jgi:hypothetical protein
MKMSYLRAALLVAVFSVLTFAVASPADAAKGGGKPPSGGTSTYGSCVVAPNPVAVGGLYTVQGTGFRAGEILNVMVKDSHGTQAFMIAADGGGAFAVSSYASWGGTSTASVYNNEGRTMSFRTSCSFQVV